MVYLSETEGGDWSVLSKFAGDFICYYLSLVPPDEKSLSPEEL